MTFDIKQPTPRTVEVLKGPHADCYDECRALEKLARKLERELLACGHEQLTCRNCGAGYKNEAVTRMAPDVEIKAGTYSCPLCGHENHWKRVSRFITT